MRIRSSIAWNNNFFLTCCNICYNNIDRWINHIFLNPSYKLISAANMRRSAKIFILI